VVLGLGIAFVAVSVTGIVIGARAGGAVAPVTAEEQAFIAQYARLAWDHPFTQLKQLSYRVERIEDPELGPCEDDQLGGWTGTDDAAWRVTAYTLFGSVAGGMTITCGGSSVD
jgi:hypothetical protein